MIYLQATAEKKDCLYGIYIRVSQNAPFSVKHSMTGSKRQLEWRGVRKYIRFLIFGNFITQPFLWIYIIWPNQKICEICLYNFKQHSLLTALRAKKSAHAHNVFFGFGLWALLARIKSFYNYLAHPSFAPYHRIFIFLGHPNIHTYVTDQMNISGRLNWRTEIVFNILCLFYCVHPWKTMLKLSCTCPLHTCKLF